MCPNAAQIFDCLTGREYGFKKFCLSNTPQLYTLTTNKEADTSQPITYLKYTFLHLGAAVAKFTLQQNR